MFSSHQLISALPVLSVGLTYVAAASFPFPLNARSIIGRQDTLDPSDIPSEAGNNCSDDNCFCTDQVNEGLEQCLNCLLGLDPSEVDDAQSALSQYEDLCNSEGFGLSSLTVSAATPTGGVPTDDGLSAIPSFGVPTQITGPSETASAGAGNTPANTQKSGATNTQAANPGTTTPASTVPGLKSGAARSYRVAHAAVVLVMGAAGALLL
ncbi:hypothetical protein EIP86_007729 [Pleurotus ostreatoroseus]|nr:hypothetical protein EIP86_007729 [Pleurotus ostreatoroseus]